MNLPSATNTADFPHPLTALRIITLPQCAICTAPTVFSCARCDNAYYCNAAHFVEHWPQHRLCCSHSANSLPTANSDVQFRHPAPEPSSRPHSSVSEPRPALHDLNSSEIVALLAHPHMRLPQLIRVPVAHHTSAAGKPVHMPAVQHFFRRRCGRAFIQFGHRMRFLQSPFHMFYCVDSYTSNTHPNRAVESMTEGAIPKPRPWPGLVLILKLESASSKTYVDLDTADIPDIREYFVHFS
ncbi:hypothetical protein C8Q76DRAFT_797456 [Earliella scabrosa]|nr:hypothetical protein C8Q76DRAFT_797456 [Earliella scabrosa]